jgi:hypothetical protein
MPDKDGSLQDAAIESRFLPTQSEKAFAIDNIDASLLAAFRLRVAF